MLRVETKENILLEAFGLSESVHVSLAVYDFPVKSRQLWQGTITLNSDNNYSFLQTVEVNCAAFGTGTGLPQLAWPHPLFIVVIIIIITTLSPRLQWAKHRDPEPSNPLSRPSIYCGPFACKTFDALAHHIL